MIEKIETDVDKLLLVLTMNKIFPIYIAKIEPFSILYPKSISAFIVTTIFQILKRKFYVFWTQTCP